MRLLMPGLGLTLVLVSGCTQAAQSPMSLVPAHSDATSRSTGSLVALGEATLSVDASSLEARFDAVESRTVADNDDLYLLDLARFMRPDTFSVHRVEREGDELAVTYRIAHPFPAPSDPDGAPSATNRADLGFAGMVLFRAEQYVADGHTFFTDVVCNTDLVTNADAYYRPAGLITNYASFANTFPYQCVVDELNGGSRVGISNNGNVTGNFGSNGWTRTELGPDRTGWTGYGVLHQGQVSERTVRLSIPAFQPADRVSLRVSLIAKYADPRGGATVAEKLAHRLPAKPMDQLAFGYRMPHGALDCERVEAFPVEEHYQFGVSNDCEFRLRVVDWDATVPETVVPDLAEDPNPLHVADGSSGLPRISLCIPGILGDATTTLDWEADTYSPDDSDVGGDPGLDTGQPGDGLFFRREVPYTGLPSRAIGEYLALFQVDDPEPEASIIPLHGTTLSPLTGDHPGNRVYQMVPVSIVPAGTGWVKTFDAQYQLEATAIQVTPTGEVYVGGTFQSGADFGGGMRSANGFGGDVFVVKLAVDGDYLWDRTFGGASTHFPEFSESISALALRADGTLLAIGGFVGTADFGNGQSLTSRTQFPDNYLAAFKPTGDLAWVVQDAVATRPGLAVVSTPGGNVLAGTLHIEAPAVWTEYNATGQFVQRIPIDADWIEVKSLAVSSNGSVFAGGDARAMVIDGVTTCTEGGGDAFLMRWSAAGQLTWAHWWGSLQDESVLSVDLDEARNQLYCGGVFRGGLNFGAGVIDEAAWDDAFVLCHTLNGQYRWEYVIGTPTADRVSSLTVAPGGLLVMGGEIGGPFDFGGGLRQFASGSSFLLAMRPDRVWEWDSTFEPGNGTTIQSVTTSPLGALAVCGGFRGSVDFDPGTGNAIRQSYSPTYPQAFVVGLNTASGDF